MHPQHLTMPLGQIRPGAFGHNRGVVKPNYAIMPPEGVMDSYLPTYERTVVRFLAVPALGAKFAQAILEMELRLPDRLDRRLDGAKYVSWTLEAVSEPTVEPQKQSCEQSTYTHGRRRCRSACRPR